MYVAGRGMYIAGREMYIAGFAIIAASKVASI